MFQGATMNTKIHCLALLCMLAFSGCGQGDSQPSSELPAIVTPPAPLTGGGPQPEGAIWLTDARAGFQTKLTRRESAQRPVAQPPATLFRTVQYRSPAGELAAYLTPDPMDGARHPAILWITGGDCNTIDEVWTAAPASNDQTAGAYRQAGIVMMFASLRGGNVNPGVREGFFGEVDDILAAAAYLASQPYIDPNRIYLGGHSTGGTLALLAAESTDCFRAVFSFGPAAVVALYGTEMLPFDFTNPREAELRDPVRWLTSIKRPTFILEGIQDGNQQALEMIQRASTNPLVHCLPIRNADHFSVLGPTNQLIARKIVADNGPQTNLSLTAEEVEGLLAQ